MTWISASSCAQPAASACQTLAAGDHLDVTWTGGTCQQCACFADMEASSGTYGVIARACDGRHDDVGAPVAYVWPTTP